MWARCNRSRVQLFRFKDFLGTAVAHVVALGTINRNQA